MSPVTHALEAFRARGCTSDIETPLPALFVLDMGLFVAASVTASWYPVATLQAFGANERSEIATHRRTVERAVGQLGARTVVVCGEGTSRPHGEERERLLGACAALLDDPILGPALRSRGVAVEALWFDTSEGDIYLWQAGARRFELLADAGLVQFFESIRLRS